MGVLEQMVAERREAVARARRNMPLDRLERQAAGRPLPRPWEAALCAGRTLCVIAEIKRSSPSAGDLDRTLNPAARARAYAKGGAAAVSVLTEPRHFGGSIEDLRVAREAISLPVLRKDFLVDEYQVVEARAAGADAVLLIVRLLPEARFQALLGLAGDLGLGVLAETHTAEEIVQAAAAGARVIGVNSRDLDTLEVNLEVALRLADHVPFECVAVAESGVRGLSDARRLLAAGYRCALVGEGLVRQPDLLPKLAGLPLTVTKSL